MRSWLDRRERFTFNFIPPPCSWLNAVESFFAKLARQRHSVVDLQETVNHCVAATYARPKPITWAADPD